MPRRRKKAGGIGDWVDEIVEVAVDNLADRARDAFAAQAIRTVRNLPSTQTYKCVACGNDVTGILVQFIRPTEGTCVCANCFKFLFNAGVEKVAFLTKRLQQKAAEAAAKKAAEEPLRPAAPPITPPWEVLGVKQDATEDEIGKAYRTIVMQWHPDRLPPELRPEGQVRISEATKARTAMLSVRRKPTEGTAP